MSSLIRKDATYQTFSDAETGEAWIAKMGEGGVQLEVVGEYVDYDAAEEALWGMITGDS